MPFPQLSPALNNCSVHSFTPELRQEIKKIAVQTENDTSYPASFINAYRSLKAHFAIFYRIEPAEDFSWAQFDSLLDSYNEFDIQILLGPVLRRVMADAMTANEDTIAMLKSENQSTQDFIESYTSLQANGRYQTVPPDVLYVFLGAQFGFKLSYHSAAGNIGSYPEADQEEGFANRPHIHLFHSGHIDGGDSHWERTLDDNERVDFSQEKDTHLGIVAGLFGYGSDDLSEICFDLLRSHVQKTFIFFLEDKRNDPQARCFFQNFHLSTAQIEKYLYNRVLLARPIAIELLGALTPQAEELISRIPDLEGIEYDQNLLNLIRHHQPNSIDYNQPIKANVNTEDYAIALTLLTPPAAQIQAHHYDRDKNKLWPIRANELLALQNMRNNYAEHILFDEGLSGHLYAICNQEDVANELRPEFLRLLRQDPNFYLKASRHLRSCASTIVTEESSLENHRYHGQLTFNDEDDSDQDTMSFDDGPFHSATSSPGCLIDDDDIMQTPAFRRHTSALVLHSRPHQTTHFPFSLPKSGARIKSVLPGKLFPETETPPRTLKKDRLKTNQALSSSSMLSSAQNVNANSFQQRAAPVPPNTHFWLRAMQIFLAIGGICALIAVLTCPPLASALGIASVCGVAVKDIALTAGFLAGTSGLIAASVFAVKKFVGEPAPAQSTELVRWF